MNKIENYILNDLPSILINIKKSIKSREERKNLLNEGHDAFVNKFLNQNTYFYFTNTELFFFYDKNDYNYKVVKENKRKSIYILIIVRRRWGK